VFLAGLGIGGFAGTALSRRVRAANALGLIQALLAGAIAFGAYAIVNILPHWQPTALFLPHVRATPSLMFTYDALRCAFALLPATLLWGASFPLTLAAGRAADFGGHVARINAINTAGALAGAIAFTLIGFRSSARTMRNRCW
jgi:spermidine synthase